MKKFEEAKVPVSIRYIYTATKHHIKYTTVSRVTSVD